MTQQYAARSVATVITTRPHGTEPWHFPANMKLVIKLSEVIGILADRHNLGASEVTVENDLTTAAIPAPPHVIHDALVAIVNNASDYARGRGYNKIETIKAVRTVAPFMGLKDAKDFVEHYLDYSAAPRNGSLDPVAL